MKGPHADRSHLFSDWDWGRTRLACLFPGATKEPILLALVTLIVFLPALWNGFVEWDDDVNLINNPNYRGLGWTQLRWMFTTFLMGHWIPLTWITFGFDYVVWGMNPVGYHLTNLLLHSVNAAVFYLVAFRLLGLAVTEMGATTLRAGAVSAALVFAVHPLRAESVAWVTERRDVLSGLFLLLSVLTYLRASESHRGQRWRCLAGSVGLYVLAISSKSIVMTLPFVLMVLDVYPLRRLGEGWRDWTKPATRRVWLEKVPYLLVSLAGGATALYAIWINAFLTPIEMYSLPDRIAMTFYSFWFYVEKTFFPLDLLPVYELPAQVNPMAPRFFLSALAVIGLTVGFFLLRRRWPAGLAVWVAYLVMLAPVSGLFHVGPSLAHDRYSYFSCLGWALLAGGGVCAVIRAGATGELRPSLTRLTAGAGTAALVGLAALTWSQVEVWRSTDTLWSYAVEVHPDCATCRTHLGVFLMNRGQSDLAIEHLERALALRPDWIKGHGDLGLALSNLGQQAEGIEHLTRALRRYPNDAQMRNNLGVALSRDGKRQEAIEQFRLALRYDPAHVGALTNLGMALIGLGKSADSIEKFRRAIELEPEEALPRFGLVRAYLALGKIGPADQEYEALKRLDHRLSVLLSEQLLSKRSVGGSPLDPK